MSCCTNFWVFLQNNNKILLVVCLVAQFLFKFLKTNVNSNQDGVKAVLFRKFIDKLSPKVGMGQLILAQLGLVPQDKDTLTQAHILATTVFVDYFTTFAYMALMTG